MIQKIYYYIYIPWVFLYFAMCLGRKEGLLGDGVRGLFRVCHAGQLDSAQSPTTINCPPLSLSLSRSSGYFMKALKSALFAVWDTREHCHTDTRKRGDKK